MKHLLSTTGWDLKLELRYQIVTITAIVTALYIAIFQILPEGAEKVATALIFSDPAMLGFMFIGALLLFEKNAHTLKALAVSPLKPGIYIGAKVLSLSVIGLGASLIMAFAAHGFSFNWLLFGIGVLYASIIFTLVGFIGVVRVETLNQYIMIVPLALTPFLLPLLNLFELTNSFWLFLIPSQAILLLMEGATSSISVWELLYGLFYPLPWIWIFYRWAEKAYRKYVLT